ncbi:MAG: hypothetical protein KGS72_23295 [Cyanobacteria bacterium REEB67]|nr:hypothetical protein [Cyanobacteria bacterium REEB67]
MQYFNKSGEEKSQSAWEAMRSKLSIHEDVLYFVELRQTAGFPSKLPDADVWIGPEAQISLTWEFDEDRKIDLGRLLFFCH